jgi:hypothetical protein
MDVVGLYEARLVPRQAPPPGSGLSPWLMLVAEVELRNDGTKVGQGR